MHPEDKIGYDEIIEDAMRSVICETLRKVVHHNGLPGKHYLVITFLTHFPGAKVPANLLEKFPEEMTIALQFQFKNLVVREDRFDISLSFAGKYERLEIPYKSITSFSDPSMNFALKFSMNYDEAEALENDDDSIRANGKLANEKEAGDVDLSAKVISLDAFRKNRNKNDPS